MAIFKCKMCGGNIDFVEGDTIGVCDSCGTKQTLPKATDEAVSSLFNRANALRLKSEFDRAAELYNKIISVDETQAEAYWGLILCKYGIEYVEDPKTFKRVPTCHRASFDAVTADEDFKLAVKHADFAQKALYQSEAKAIDDIQKDILKIAANEKPFDVFICYKETDNYGRRTQDSVTANEIYHQLTQAGYKVFYSAITLEDKLGQEYEPYIFAALNSAKVMLVIGSKPEYFTAVWVKNEWSRFLKLMSNDRSKLLIPCYKDMDAYELPDDFAHLQAQDMSKIGFINDVIRGIKKVTDKANDTSIEKVAANNTQANASTVALKKRGFMALEDGEWKKANGFFEDALNWNAEDSECYLGKLMVNLKVGNRENLKDCDQPFDSNQNYVKACRFDKSIEQELNGYISFINERNETDRKNAIYDNAVNVMNSVKTDSPVLTVVKDEQELYQNASDVYKKLLVVEDAIKKFESISGWSNADEKAAICKQKADELREKQEKYKTEAKRFNQIIDNEINELSAELASENTHYKKVYREPLSEFANLIVYAALYVVLMLILFVIFILILKPRSQDDTYFCFGLSNGCLFIPYGITLWKAREPIMDLFEKIYFKKSWKSYDKICDLNRQIQEYKSRQNFMLEIINYK